MLEQDTFLINRVVIQGYIISPMYFILELQLILETCDNSVNKDVDFNGHEVYTIGYPDDVDLLDKTAEETTSDNNNNNNFP